MRGLHLVNLNPARLGDLYLALGLGALWHQEEGAWRELQPTRNESSNGRAFGWAGTLAMDANGVLVGVGVGAGANAYQIVNGSLILREYYLQTATSTSFGYLAGHARLSSAFLHQGQNHLLSYEGGIFRLEGPSLTPVPVATAGQGNIADALSADERLLLAGAQGGISQVFADTLEVCAPTDALTSAELIVDGRTLYLLSRQSFIIQVFDLPPLAGDCGLPAGAEF